MKNFFSFFFIIFIFFLNFSLFAHDIWIEPQNNTYVLLYGHITEKHEGTKIIEYNPQNLLKTICYNTKGKLILLTPIKKYPITVKQKCTAIYMQTSSGYWTKTPYGTKNLTKDKAQMPIKSWLSYESVKYLNEWNQQIIQNPIDDLDIQSLNNPFQLKVGDKLHLLITYGKKPIKNIAVAYNGKLRGISDKDGKINIKIKKLGLQYIQASYSKKIKSKLADHIITSTTLNFKLSKK